MKNLRNQKGAALVEFALVFPILFLTLIAVLSMLWMLTARSSISGAARDGARFASIRHDPLSCPFDGSSELKLSRPITIPLPPAGPCDDYPTEAEVDEYVRQRAGNFSVESVDLVRPDGPRLSNEPVTVTVRGKLPVIFQPVASLFGNGDLEFVSVAKVRAE